jgi:CDP-diacylglycerol--glycerol-3-phosphate 3-phosphatidyltransferase
MSTRAKLVFVTFLTVVRFPLVVLFFVGALVETHCPHAWLFAATLATLILASVTDTFDGFFARKFGVETTFGAHADPLMDKLFYVVSFPLLVFLATKNDHRTHAMFLLVLTLFFLTRDQWVTFLRSMGSLHDMSGASSWTGKLRTTINFPLICTIYHFEESPVHVVNSVFLYVFESVAFVVNMVSVWLYTRRYWFCLRESVKTR